MIRVRGLAVEHNINDEERKKEKFNMYEMMKNYKENEALRLSFNELAGKTFGLDFEDWYQNGFWRENYVPYSFVENGKVIANVSVNITDILWNGEIKKLIQLGTVMTEETHRNKGLIRQLMEEVEKDYGTEVDGMYLFANDSVVEFYPKFGYKKVLEYQYSKEVEITGEQTMKQVLMDNAEQWERLEKAMNENTFHGQFDMVNNNGLYMFYVSKFMQECVYYQEETDTYVIAEVDGNELMIHSIFSKKQVELDDIINAFGKEIKKVVLGFVPKDASGYQVTEVEEEDTTLFVKEAAMEGFTGKKLMFPTLAHA
ncbi:MAG: GNAT family N-acetyltransferase [Lachnospiraceae bacterium]|nr:GNAT family N-acetyltransferase [Lachnospiraceae bacterium]